MLLSAIAIGIEEGCKYVPFMVATCVVIRLARFPDFGLEGSFALGAAAAAFSSKLGFPPYVGLSIAMLCGLLAGGLTSFLFVICRLNSLISGIVTAMVAFTACYCLLGWRSVGNVNVWVAEHAIGLAGAVFALLLVVAFSTRSLLVVRFAGENPALLRQLGLNASFRYTVLLALGNALTAISGALVAGVQGTATLRFGDFVLFQALVALIMGEGVFSIALKIFSLLRSEKNSRRTHSNWCYTLSTFFSGSGAAYILVSAVLGSFCYWVIYNLCTSAFGADEYTKLALGILTAIFLIASEHIGASRKRLPAWSFIGRMP